MTAKPRDYSVLDKLNFERKPVGVKFLPVKPEGIPRIAKRLSFCEMFKEAQTSPPFYVQREDLYCIEPFILGMEDPDPMLLSGLVGEADGLFEEARANRKVYQYLPKMLKGSVNYVAFSSIDRLTFDPDVVVFTANASQTYHLLRALNYSSGDMWSFKGSTCLSCAWIYAHPYLNGELNLTVSGLGYSMKARGVLPEGLLIITVPFDLLSGFIENLKEMEWEPYWFKLGRDGFVKEVRKRSGELAQELAKD